MPNSRASEGGRGAVEQREAEAQRRDDESGSVDAERSRDLAAELADMEDRYRRALADLDNYRKRAARDTDRRVADALDAQLRQWLEAVDSVERALSMEPDGVLLEGLRAVLEQMEAILARQGVRRLGEPGERFDPERHEAVGVRFSDQAPDHTVAEVARSGFALGDRVLRPAEVIVSRARPDDG
jgi:molecular chaperone GrpE